jgi:phosphoesterase RecJ-like protein
MSLDWTPFVSLVRQHRRFLLTTHVRPDGDGLGSMLALASTLEEQGKSVRMVVASVLPPRYDFLDPARRIRRFQLPGEEYRDCEAILVLDTGTWNQLGELGTLIRDMPVPKAVIDHHPTQDELGALRLVDTSAEATGRLVHEAIQALGVPLRAPVAQALFVAVAMDTGWYRHGNTTPATFKLVAQLVEAGANPTSAYGMLFEHNSLSRLLLTGLVLGRLQVCHEGTISHTAILRDDYAQTRAIPQDSEDLVNYTLSIAGVEVGLFFMEQPAGGIKVSLRSRSADVGKVAERFGGGGHRLASGVILQTTLDEARKQVIAAVAEVMASSS